MLTLLDGSKCRATPCSQTALHRFILQRDACTCRLQSKQQSAVQHFRVVTGLG